MVSGSGTAPCHTDHSARPSTKAPKLIIVQAFTQAARARHTSAAPSTASDTP